MHDLVYNLVVEVGRIGLLGLHIDITASASQVIFSNYHIVNRIPLENWFIRSSIHGYNEALKNA